MQNFKNLSSSEKTAVLNSMTTGAQYQLQDSRDNKTYYISKLADGNVWMTQNLDHDIVTTANFYTPANTDITSNWTASTATRTNTTWTSSMTAPESYDPGDYCWNGTITSNGNGALATCSDTHKHLGNYYNWTAAIAMNNSSSYTTETNVNQSICPAGWTLPKSGNNTGSGSFAYLVNQQALTGGTAGNVHQSPAYFVYGGYYNGGGSIYKIGSWGSYQSSTVFDSDIIPQLYFSGSSSGVQASSENVREEGSSVRCVAR